MLAPEIQAYIDEQVARAVARRMPPPQETFHKVRAVADRLGMHSDSVLRHIHAGRICSIGAGKLLRVPELALAEFLEASSNSGRDTAPAL